MKVVRISVTTDGSGDASTTVDAVAGGGCALYGLVYLPGTIDTGATVTVTDETNGGSFTLYAKSSAGTSNIRKYPRVLEQLNTDGSDITGQYVLPLVTGRPKVVIASGGATKTGAVILYLMEL